MPSSASICWRGLAPTDDALDPAVAEQADHRDALHAVLLGDARLVVDVDLHDLVGALTHRGDRLDDRRHLAARPAPRRPEVDDHRQLAAQHLGFERAVVTDGTSSTGSSGSASSGRSPASTCVEPLAARRAGSRSRPDAPSGTRGTRSGTPSSRRPRARSRDRCTGISGSCVPCCTSTGTSRAASSRSKASAERERGAHREDARGPRPRRSASSAERRARDRRPARSRRRSRLDAAKPSAAHCSSTSSSSSSSAARLRTRLRCRRRSRTRRSPALPGTASGPRGKTVANAPSGSRYGQEPAEVALVGAVPVHEQQQPRRRSNPCTTFVTRAMTRRAT